MADLNDRRRLMEQEGYQYNAIDLGLPSGLLWCDRNVCAYSPKATGLSFAWGEIIGFSERGTRNYVGSSYKFGWPPIKYNNSDSLTTLQLCDDAAFVNMGDNWRMPTVAECRELLTNCYIVDDKINEVTIGCFFTGPNGNSIYIPSNISFQETRTFMGLSIWSSSAEASGYAFYFDINYRTTNWGHVRYHSMGVRGVYNKI